jgi:hypothetical protein
MAISTYSELKSAVADFLNRDDLTATIPTFIGMAEASLNRDVRHWKMEQRSTAEIDDQYLTLPTDWLATVRITVQDTTPYAMNLVSRDSMQDMRYKGDNVAGKPLYYAHVAGEIEMYPTPDATYDIELLYTQKIDALSDSNTSNWLLTDAPDLYLYAVLLETAIYLRDDERISAYAGMYQSKLAALNSSSNKATVSGTGLKLNIRSYK